MKNTEEDFVAGAQSEREELLRWRDPNVVLPKVAKLPACKDQDGETT